MADFATLEDVMALWRPLTEAEQTLAESLLPIISDRLRAEAYKVGKDLDAMILEKSYLASVAKSVTVDIFRRYVNDNSSKLTDLSQYSQSAGGYTVSGTFLNAGGGIFVKKAELSALGLRKQRYGVIEMYADDTGADS